MDPMVVYVFLIIAVALVFDFFNGSPGSNNRGNSRAGPGFRAAGSSAIRKSNSRCFEKRP